jgi:hypothetical protein
MVGSMLVFELHDWAELDDWLASEPYVKGRVWETVEVTECAIPPIFK